MPRTAKTARTKTHFTPELFRFLRQLDRNNDRDWFQRNKDRYVTDVRDPMLEFIADFAPRLARVSRRFVADPRPTGGSMFRIHRDVRFAKDKSPYKTFASAQFRHEVGRNVHAPGFYLHLEPGNVFFGGGIWRPDGAAVAAVRDAIVEEPARWRRLTSSKAQRETFELAGECLKRPPRGYDPEHSHIDDLKRKDFICVAHIEEGRVCGDGFVDEIATLCRQSAPFVRFLTDALDLEF